MGLVVFRLVLQHLGVGLVDHILKVKIMETVLDAVGDGITGGFNGVDQILHPDFDLPLRAHGADNQKFVAAQPEHVCLGEAFHAGVGNKAEHLVTRRMTQTVVELMQTVHIDVDHGQTDEILLRGGLGEVGKGGAVFEARCCVKEAGRVGLLLGQNQIAPGRDQLTGASHQSIHTEAENPAGHRKPETEEAKSRCSGRCPFSRRSSA